MPASNFQLDRVSVSSLSGWVKLSSAPLICDAQVQPLSSLISIRWNGTPAGGIALNTNSIYYFNGVDLSKLEISTTSGTAVACIVIAQAPQGA